MATLGPAESLFQWYHTPLGIEAVDSGSGPTELLCGRLTDRLKGPGMRWDKDNAEAMMALASLDHSGLWDTYWKSVRAAA